jgi:hypothetical protein
MSDDDLLTDLWRVLARQVGTSAADRELLGLRQRWGGVRLYLRKAPAFQKQQQLGEKVATGTPVGDAINDAGCKRAWGYELLGRRLRR